MESTSVAYEPGKLVRSLKEKKLEGWRQTLEKRLRDKNFGVEA